MSRALVQSRFKVERLCSVNISGSPKSSVHKRPYKPGQHGKNERLARKRVSPYGAQLNDLRIFSAFYGNLNFSVILKYAKKALGSKGDMIESFAQQFELHLAMAVYRLKWAPTIGTARQMLAHGNAILLNGKKVDRGYIKPGDRISLTESVLQSQAVIQGQAVPTRQVPTCYECEGTSATLKHLPALSEIHYPFQAKLGSVLRHCRRFIKKSTVV